MDFVRLGVKPGIAGTRRSSNQCEDPAPLGPAQLSLASVAAKLFETALLAVAGMTRERDGADGDRRTSPTLACASAIRARVSAASFELVARRSKARYVAGLLATVARKGEHHPIISMQCGPVRHRVDARVQAAERGVRHRARDRTTAFELPASLTSAERPSMPAIYAALAQDDARNDLICIDGQSPEKRRGNQRVSRELPHDLKRQFREPHGRRRKGVIASDTSVWRQQKEGRGAILSCILTGLRP